MKQILKIALLMLVALNLSCSAYKKLPYLQDSELLEVTLDKERYSARIVSNDILSIFVNSTDPIAAESFNLIKPTRNSRTSNSTAEYINYIVDEEGSIEFPLVGEITVVGMTCRELEEVIKESLKKYLVESPLVTVTMTDFKVSVIGEVAKPGVVTIASGKANLFEVLAMAGDLTIYGVRDNVKLVREDLNGNRSVVTLDLNDPSIIYSDYYYLQQNDVVYVSPNKSKGNTSAITTSTTIWISFVSTFVSIASLIAAIVL